MQADEFSAILLAGGRSSRMGRDKAELVLNGKSLLEWQAAKLRSLGVREILLSGEGHYCTGTRTVSDVYPGRGPLGGLHACLSAASTAHCIVLSVDVPLVPSAVLHALMERHAVSGAEATVLCHGDRREPLIGVYDSALADRTEALIRNGAPPVKALLRAVRAEVLPVEDDPAAFLNCNTPETFVQIQRILAG